MLKVDIASQNTLSNEVIVHFDMLCTRIEHRVPSKIDNAHVVTQEGIQYPLEPYGSPCNQRRAPVFHLCARKSDGWLLLATPGYCSATEGENKSGGQSSIGFVASLVGICVPLKSNWHCRLVENSTIHCAADVSQYSISAIQVNVGSSDHEIDEAPD